MTDIIVKIPLVELAGGTGILNKKFRWNIDPPIVLTLELDALDD